MRYTAEIAPRAQVLLVSPPWMKAGWPCLGIAALKSCLAADGIAVECSHFHLETAARLGWDNYDGLAEACGAGEALFGALIDHEDAARLTAYAGRELRTAGFEALADWAEGPACTELQQLIDLWIDDIGAIETPIIGVSVGAMQLCAAIYLVQRLAQRGHRGVRVLGGSGLVGSCGTEVLRRVPKVDYVVQGEGEESFSRLVHALLEGLDRGSRGAWSHKPDGAAYQPRSRCQSGESSSSGPVRILCDGRPPRDPKDRAEPVVRAFARLRMGTSHAGQAAGLHLLRALSRLTRFSAQTR